MANVTIPNLPAAASVAGDELLEMVQPGNAAAGVSKRVTINQLLQASGLIPTGISVLAGTGLSGGGQLTATRTLSIGNTAVVAGIYGSGSVTPVLTVNAQGQITNVTLASILESGLGGVPTSRQVLAGTGLSGGGDLTIDRTFLLGNTAVVAGTYGSSTAVPILTVDAQGRLTNVGVAPVSASGFVPNNRQVLAGTGLSGGGDLSVDRTFLIGLVTGDVTTSIASLSTVVARIQGAAVAGTTGSGNVVFSGSPTLTGVPAAPTQTSSDNSTKIATTAYVTTAVTNAIAGVNPAVAVSAATTAASDTSGLTYNNGVSGIGATLTGLNNTAVTWDGFTFTALNQRGLVKNDTQSPSGAFNGIYIVTQLQTGITPPILTRALDYDQPSDINSTGAIPVTNGTANATTSWVLTSTVNTVGTDPLTFTQFTLAPTTIVTTSRQVLAGTGLSGGGTLAADRTFLISSTGVAAATYGSGTNIAALTVNAQGQVTAASSTSGTVAQLGRTQAFTKGQSGAVTGFSGTSVGPAVLDLSLSNNWAMTATSGFVLGRAINVTSGQSGVIAVTQSSSGNCAVTYQSGWLAAGGTKPTLSTAAGQIDILTYYASSTSSVVLNSLLNVS